MIFNFNIEWPDKDLLEIIKIQYTGNKPPERVLEVIKKLEQENPQKFYSEIVDNGIVSIIDNEVMEVE